MADVNKGRSPFYPGQPVPPEYFVGREDLVQTLMRRGAGQVAAGKPVAFFVQGEYGIGKSSLATYAQAAAANKLDLHPVYASVGGAKTVEDVARVVLEATVESGASASSRGERVRNWLARYVGKQQLVGISLNLEHLKADAPQIATPTAFLGFFAKAVENLETPGIFLVLDELNGIASNPDFAHFLKALIETNGVSAKPVPLLIALCGVEERRAELIRSHGSLDRLFHVLPVERMTEEEMRDCFVRSFALVGIEVDTQALDVLVRYSAGLPKILQVIGDAAYFRNESGKIDLAEAIDSVFEASEEVGRKFVDQQVLRALRSEDYKSILDRLAIQTGPMLHEPFTRRAVSESLSEGERRKLDNCLRKLRDLNVIRSTGRPGEYEFVVEMVRLYLVLSAAKRTQERSSRPNA